ncbi:glycerate dehydrogenase [Lachnoclostridium sp. An14]|uniref:D-2-hydroxyacid dehydrogenase n=1 Tax=Lachnoclostridium sp. An14 TaxID=1965562 RepID=UPI000B39E563|nr:D-2-hydroxyacid dehydrogenase [Lachnoclostridium sp. An14]OUQ13644.1 glycerate dehydrogenase [Lachnoclostridium sp. An14]
MKIVILDGYTENPGDLSWDGFRRFGEVTVYDRTPAEQTVERIGDADIVYTNKTPITKEVLEQCPGIRYIGTLATGYNVVDVETAAKRGIPVCNVPGYGTAAVAQFTIGLLLELCHRIGAHSDSVKAGQWSACPDFCYWNFPQMELAGKTMGIVGFGSIGREVGRLAQAFGMEVLAYSRTKRPELETEHCRFVTLEELFERSDVISLHCPLFPETEGMINRSAIEKMKDGVLLLNTARGQLIVEEDLRAALDRGKVGGAALDVVAKEPISPDNPLLGAENIILTPHIAWAPKESRQRLMDIAVGNLKAFVDGKAVNVVNGVE